jgi:F-type H+-transporting ATPase subunit epsilon
MQVTIAKVHENVFQGEAKSLTVPTSEGELTIMPKHEPLVATLKEGTITVRTATGEQTFFASSGVLEISSDQVTVLL